MTLTDNERKVLACLVVCGEDYAGYNYFAFGAITEPTKLERAVVRRACRSLKRKGLAEFASGLWSEDGEPAGAGYRASAAGVDLIKSAPRPRGATKQAPQLNLFDETKARP